MINKDIFIRTLFVYICFVIVIAPNFSVSPIMGFDEKRLLVLAAFFGACIPFMFLNFTSPVIKLAEGGRAIILTLLICFFSAGSIFFSYSPRHALMEAGSLGGIFLLMLVIASGYHKYDKEMLSWLGWSIVVAVLFNVTVSVYQYVFELSLSSSFRADSFLTGFMNKRFLNHYQTWTTPLLAWGFLYLNRPKLLGFAFLRRCQSIILYSLGVAWWVLVFASHGRGVALSLLISWIIVFVVLKAGSKRIVSLHIKQFLLGVVCSIVFLYLAPFLRGNLPAEGGVRLGGSGRIDIWLEAIYLWKEHLVFGVGPMHYAHFSSSPVASPHNTVLQIGLEWGLGVLVIVGVGVFWGGRVWLELVLKESRKNIQKSDLRATLTWCLLAALIYSNVTGITNTPMSQLMLAVVSGIVLGEFFLSQNKSERKAGLDKLFVITGKVLIILFMLCAVIAVFYDFTDRLIMGPEFPGWTPRFWLAGRF